MPDLALNYNYKVEIDTTPSSDPTWAELYEGWKNLKEALNEVLHQATYFGKGGWGSTDVTGGQMTIGLSGVRMIGDAAQDYIFSNAVRYNWGSARKTNLRVTAPDGAMVLWSITLAKIDGGSGDANNANEISVELHGNGAPSVISGGVVIEPLIVVSVAGSLSGDTAIYVNPSVEASNSYKYKTAPTVDLPALDAVLTTGWTAWDGDDEITATTGNQIVIAEVETSTNKAKKAGKATVTSLA